jgi:GNAT superfamily N-acetyltransferase
MTMAGADTVRDLEVHPLTPERWDDFERLFGANGACGGCWCMWFRLTARQFEAGKGEGNRAAIRALVTGGAVPGLLAYAGGAPVGWCAVAPRGEYPRLARSRTLAPVDDRPVWSVVCFFVARAFRGKGVSRCLLAAAVEHVRARGGRLVEGYAVEPKAGRMPDVFAYHGTPSLFRACGFEEVARRSPTRPIMRRRV